MNIFVISIFQRIFLYENMWLRNIITCDRCGWLGFMFSSWTNIRTTLFDDRYVPHLIDVGLGTGFEERCDNEIRSDSLDQQLHGWMSLRQCRKVRWRQGGRAEGPGTYECFVNCLKFNATCPSCNSCKCSDLPLFYL